MTDRVHGSLALLAFVAIVLLAYAQPERGIRTAADGCTSTSTTSTTTTAG